MNRVLVIEDDEVMVSVLRRALVAAEMEVVSVYSGAEAMDKLRTHKVDAVILDLHLPEVSGVTILKHIRSHPVLHKLPVFVLTSGLVGHLVQEAYRIGATEVLTKDKIRPAELVAMIRSQLQSQESATHKRVLLVEDHLETSRYLTQIFHHAGFAVEIAEDATSARVKLTKQKPDVVFLKIAMPWSDSIAFLRHIRGHTEFQSLPVIAFTHESGSDFMSDARDAGATDFLTKIDLSAQKIMQIVRNSLLAVRN